MRLCAKKLKSLFNAGFLNQLSISRKPPHQFIRSQSVPSLAHYNPYFSDSGPEELISSSLTKNGSENPSELNSAAVVQILQNMRSEPYYAFSFFNQLREKGFRHDTATYLAMIKVLCCWGMDGKSEFVFKELINSKKGDYLGLLDAIAEELKDESPSSQVRAFDSLIKSYADLKMFNEAIHSLYKARRLGMGPTLSLCNYLMDRLFWHGQEGQEAAVAVYKELRNMGLEPNVYSYAIAVKAYRRMGSLEEAREVARELDSFFTDLIMNLEKGDNLEVLDAMADGARAFDALIKTYASLEMFDEAIRALYEARRLGLGPCLLSCNFLMNMLVGHGKGGQEAAIAIYKELKNMGLEPNQYTYGIAIKAYCRMGSLESLVDAGKVFLEMEKAGELPNLFTYTPYLEGLCSHGYPGLAYEELQDLHARNVGPDAYAYGTVIRGYCDSGDIVGALAVHEEMESRGIRTNCSILSSILQCLCLKGRHSEAVEMFVNYEKSGVFLDGVVHNVAMDALCKMGKLDEAERLFEEMKAKKLAPDVVHYTTLMDGYCLSGNTLKAHRLFDEMNRSGLTADTISYNVLARGLSRNGLLEVSELLNTMENQGLTPNKVTHSMIVEGLCHGEKVKEAEICFKELSSQEIFINRNSCATLISKLCLEGQYNKAIKVLKIMLSTDEGPNKTMYDKLIAALCRAGDMENARWAFDQMVGRGLTPDVVIYTIMLNGYCLVNRMGEAFTLFSDMKKMGIAPDVKTYTVLISGYCKQGNVDRALSLEAAFTLFSDMKKMGIAPDVKTYTALISGYCKQGNMDKALSLKAEMLSQGIQPDTMMERKVKFRH